MHVLIRRQGVSIDVHIVLLPQSMYERIDITLDPWIHHLEDFEALPEIKISAFQVSAPPSTWYMQMNIPLGLYSLYTLVSRLALLVAAWLSCRRLSFGSCTHAMMWKHKRDEKRNFRESPLIILIMHVKTKWNSNLLENMEWNADQKARPTSMTVAARTETNSKLETRECWSILTIRRCRLTLFRHISFLCTSVWINQLNSCMHAWQYQSTFR